MWTKYKFEVDKILTSKAGNTKFWINKLDQTWQIVTKSVSDEKDSESVQFVDSLSEDLEWDHYVADKHTSILILPALPDRSIIVRPKHTLKVLPKTSFDFFIKIPVWIQLYSSANKPENLIMEFPSVKMSSTWFGEPDNGLLAYSLMDDIIHKIDLKSVLNFEALCPVKIRNESTTVLNFDRLAIEAELLTLYKGDNILCTSEVLLKHKGDDQSSEVQIGAGNPKLDENLKQINSPRILPSKNLIKKSFYIIKSIAQY
ncbi:MAG: DUF432 domain-containing protein [Bacteroidales bacterium]|nr:DUF432 domain-containing protein [Bacteroidales bacterium]